MSTLELLQALDLAAVIILILLWLEMYYRK
jgi:hypothetical protein